MLRRIILVTLLFILIFGGLIWAINRRGGAPDQDVEVKVTKLVDYADTSTEVKYILRGPINALENHRILEITVGRNRRSAVIYEGYNGNILRAEDFINTQAAYSQFLAALENNGYTNTRIAEPNIIAEGACSGDRRADFEITQGSETLQSLWTTSCSGVSGTFAGNSANIRRLFEAQLPDYNEFVNGVNF